MRFDPGARVCLIDLLIVLLSPSAKIAFPYMENSKFCLPLIAILCCPWFAISEESGSGDNQVRVVLLSPHAIVPDAEIDSSGVIHVAYFADNDVYYTKSSNDGESFSDPLRINAEVGFASGGRFRGPDIAVGKQNRIHVVWYNDGYKQKRPEGERGVMYSRLDADGKRFEKARNLNRKPSDNFSLAADANGQVAVVWMAGGVFVNLSKDGGGTFAAPVSLKVDPCECCGSRALYLKDGNLAVLYRDKTDNIRDAYLAQLPSGSKAISSNVKISRTPWPIVSCPMTGGFLSRSQTGLIAAWETKGQIYFTSLNMGDEEGVSKEIRAAEKGRYPVSLSKPDGATLVAWKNGTRLEWQHFDLSNRLLGKRRSVDGKTEHRPAGVVTQAGRVLLFP